MNVSLLKCLPFAKNMTEKAQVPIFISYPSSWSGNTQCLFNMICLWLSMCVECSLLNSNCSSSYYEECEKERIDLLRSFLNDYRILKYLTEFAILLWMLKGSKFSSTRLGLMYGIDCNFRFEILLLAFLLELILLMQNIIALI